MAINIHPSSEVQANQIGEGTSIWQFCVVLKGAVIGKNCNINANVFIESDVIIGDNVTIKSGVQIWNGLIIGNNVFISPNVTFTNDRIPRSKIYPKFFQKTIIEEGASIGANATILSGLVIGKYSFIGAGSVLTKSVPAFTLWYGVPAVKRGYISRFGVLLNEGLKDKEGNKYKLFKDEPIPIFSVDSPKEVSPSFEKELLNSLIKIPCISKFEIKRYSIEQRNFWNAFVENSKNGTFLFLREYMDYHNENFLDYSLMVYRSNELYAILPANRVGNSLHSHQGLTYGGFLLSSKTGGAALFDVFMLMNDYLTNEGIDKVIYKPIPYIYHTLPSQEDLYALFRCGAKLIGRQISSTIYQNRRIKFVESRLSGLRKALRNSLIVEESEDYLSFWKILTENLAIRHGKLPVHTLVQIEYLHKKFPNNIKLHLVSKNLIAIAGAVVYISAQVVHVQYISSNQTGKDLGALDLLFENLINTIYEKIPIFDFGHSNEQLGHELNENLLFQKEGFGGRGIMYDVYEYDL